MPTLAPELVGLGCVRLWAIANPWPNLLVSQGQKLLFQTMTLEGPSQYALLRFPLACHDDSPETT
jgi:hypothetical protein